MKRVGIVVQERRDGDIRVGEVGRILGQAAVIGMDQT